MTERKSAKNFEFTHFPSSLFMTKVDRSYLMLFEFIPIEENNYKENRRNDQKEGGLQEPKSAPSTKPIIRRRNREINCPDLFSN